MGTGWSAPPRWNPGVAAAIGRLGGVSTIFLTLRDDVADAARLRAALRAERIIHARDRSAMPDAEIVIEGDETIAFGPCTIVPTPGHCVLHQQSVPVHRRPLAWMGSALYCARTGMSAGTIGRRSFALSRACAICHSAGFCRDTVTGCA
jgi:hypothetical protein